MKSGIAIALVMAVLPVASAPQVPAPEGEMTLITLGTGGGPLTRGRRSESASAVVVNGTAYLIDTGDGVMRQMAAAGLALASLGGIFVTHNHVDHNGDLGTLLVKRWVFRNYAPLPLYGPPGTAALARGTLAANQATAMSPIDAGPLGPPMVESIAPRDLPASLSRPKEIFRDRNIRVVGVSNAHFHLPNGSEAEPFAHSYGYRVEARGRVIVFTGDSGPSPALVELARGADVLVSEVIDLPAVIASLRNIPGLTGKRLAAMIQHQRHDHLTPEQVGELARDAGVKRVVLSHLAPGLDTETDTRPYSEGVRRIFPGPVSVASDLERF